MINTGGIKVNPEEIEKALEPTLIGHFFVTSVPDPVLGEQLILVLEQSQDLDFSGLHKHHRPKDVLIREFIFTETGKVDRKRTLASQNRY